ncbi:hypothetical protein AOB57_008635 [Methanosarcina flavescens]|uniref:Uncharacterized protein n=1 Tax=Methanosarcina flavescens TaxID=1715806 RepID=A0A660HSH9_9EURY|nr:hypothetical protein AOB57_008635 [Methanosarcina flavescens]
MLRRTGDQKSSSKSLLIVIVDREKVKFWLKTNLSLNRKHIRCPDIQDFSRFAFARIFSLNFNVPGFRL